MSFRVAITPTGQRTVNALRGKARLFRCCGNAVGGRGMQSRELPALRPPGRPDLSVSLYGRYRALVCFPDEARVVVLLVGEHRRDDPQLDIYRQLYRLLELPEPSSERTKPPCCEDDNDAPVDPELLDRFEAGAKRLRGRSRRRARPRRPDPADRRVDALGVLK